MKYNFIKSRNKLIQKCKEPVKGLLIQLNSALAEKSSNDIIGVIESVSANILELPTKKLDQKREKSEYL